MLRYAARSRLRMRTSARVHDMSDFCEHHNIDVVPPRRARLEALGCSYYQG